MIRDTLKKEVRATCATQPVNFPTFCASAVKKSNQLFGDSVADNSNNKNRRTRPDFIIYKWNVSFQMW